MEESIRELHGFIDELFDRIKALEERVKELEGLYRGSEWFSPRQALAYLSISKATFYKAVHEGKLPLYKLDLKDSKLVRVKKVDLDQLFKLSE